MTRGEIAALLYNALTAEYLIPRTLSNGMVVYEQSTVIEEVFGYEMDEATLYATNEFALEGSAVVKTGYVSLKTSESKMLTVKLSALGITDADEALGHSFRIVYNVNDNGTIDILSATKTSTSKAFTSATVNSGKTHLTVDGTAYTVVKDYSDILATNDNELKVFAYENGSKLTQITSVSTLPAFWGCMKSRTSSPTKQRDRFRGSRQKLQLGTLSVSESGKINLAGNLTADELTGGFTNNAEAENGDYVLYFYNSYAKRLDIDYLADVAAGTITRLTTSTVKLSETTYNLGCTEAGITAESIRSQLKVGTEAAVIVWNARSRRHSTPNAPPPTQILVAKSDATLSSRGQLPLTSNGDRRRQEQKIHARTAPKQRGLALRYMCANRI